MLTNIYCDSNGPLIPATVAVENDRLPTDEDNTSSDSETEQMMWLFSLCRERSQEQNKICLIDSLGVGGGCTGGEDTDYIVIKQRLSLK